MSTEKRQMIHGVEVVFPCKPYPSQFSMMEKVIKGIERRQNCLLESPTGSGKSLALLCSALAWQTAQIAKRDKEENFPSNEKNVCTCGKKEQVTCVDVKEDVSIIDKSSNRISLDDEDDDFKREGKQFRTPGSTAPLSSKSKKPISISYDTNEGSFDNDTKGFQNIDQSDDSLQCCTCCNTDEKAVSRRIPKIFFGTRTHKQVAQIIRELKKTAYREARMTILASREHTCVHPEVSKMKNKNEGCKEMLDGYGCRFNDRVKKVLPSQDHLKSLGLSEAWDIEDLAMLGRKEKVCPYFGSRSLMRDADIIFCPYNYLIDPVVRDAMEINLKGQIIILDEAHNMEDSAREAASESIKEEQLQKAIEELDEMIRYDIKTAEHLRMRQMCSGLLKLINDNLGNLQQMDYDNEYRHWSGYDVVARLEQIGIGPKHFQDLLKCYGQIYEDLADPEKIVRDVTGKEVKLSSLTHQCLEHIFKVLLYLYKKDLKFVPDYRMAIVKSKVFVKKQDTENAWLNSKQRGRGSGMTSHLTYQFALNFWCMNPGVAFSDFDVCRSIVLTSGTLSPMSSFESELGVPFPIKLEANHVIEDKQVWVGAIGHGPNGSSLQCVYKTMETWTFQDELGALVLNVCQTVPCGVLCFMPSYNAIDKFRERWKRTGLWDKIQKKKRILVEPRASERVDFEEIMRSFYDTIHDAELQEEDGSCGDRNGALFIAVCRGKVSEGMDFTDNNARAVITVGIPFPNFKDVQVKLKREYNDTFKTSRGLLSGSEWYEIQAFRALNQALGRCIRHRKDWGALIIVDERFVKSSARYCKGLSKWVRNKVQPFHNFQDAMTSVDTFTTNRLKDMPKVSSDTSFILCTPNTSEVTAKQTSYNESPLTSTPHSKVLPSPWSNLPTHPFFTPYKGDNSEKADNMLTPFKASPLSSTPCKSSSETGKEILSKSIKSTTSSVQSLTTVQKSQIAYSLLSPTHVQQSKNYKQMVSQQQVVKPTVSKENQLIVNDAEAKVGKCQGHEKGQGQNENVKSPNQSKALQQVMDIINLPGVPKTKPYYIIFNEGTPCQQTFLIEPPKQEEVLLKEKRETAVSKKEETTPNSSKASTSSISLDTSFNTSNKGSTSVSRTSLINSATKSSKFFKFHTVSENINAKSNSNSDSTLQNKLNDNPNEKRPETPVLFNNTEEDEIHLKEIGNDKNVNEDLITDKSEIMASETDEGLIKAAMTDKSLITTTMTDKEVVTVAKKVISRKPLFKQKEATIETRVKCETDEGSQNDYKASRPLNPRKSLSKMKNITKIDDSNVNVIPKTETNCNESGVEGEQVISSTKISDVKKEDLSLSDQNSKDIKEIKSEEEDKQVHPEEDLKTRRNTRGIKRRKSASKVRDGKRLKGVDFLDGIEDSKENTASEKSSILCSTCGKILIPKLTEFQRRKRYPSFLKCLGIQRNAEVVYCPEMNLQESELQVKTIQHDGLMLNSLWEAEIGCCVQYIECKHCVKKGTESVIGARVSLTSGQSQEYKEGQTWLPMYGITVKS